MTDVPKSAIRNHKSEIALSAAIIALTLAGSALAIHPGKWVHNTEAEYLPGKTQDTVVTNLGDVKLSAGTSLLADLAEDVTIINDMHLLPAPGRPGAPGIAAAGEMLYIATETHLIARPGLGENVKADAVFELKSEQLFALDRHPDGRLLLGLSGKPSRLAVLEGDRAVTLVELPGVRYIWDMKVDGQIVYLATGTDGLLLRVDLTKVQPPAQPANPAVAPPEAPNAPAAPDAAKAPEAAAPTATPAPQAPAEVPNAKPAKAADADEADKQEAAQQLPELPAGVTVLLDAKQANLLCLGQDGRGRLYAGTDIDGLVYRITLGGEAVVNAAPPGQPGDAPAAAKGDKAGKSGKADAAGAPEKTRPIDPRVVDTFVLYDAPEPEIGALLVLADGTVYAGTADAEQARPGRLKEAATVPEGRPAPQAAAGQPPAAPPEVPDPGDIPNVPPQPQPKAPQPGVPPAPEKPAEPGAVAPAVGEQAQAEPPAEPTAAQLDELRDVIRQRLLAARQSGAVAMQQSQVPGASRGAALGAAAASPAAPGGGAAAKGGNAVYRIDPHGFVTEIFRETVMILRLVEDPGAPDAPAGASRLLVATGNEGQLYRIDPAAEETLIIADLEPQQIPAILVTPDRQVLLGTANAATVARLEKGYAGTGTYTSPVLDAAQISLWGKLHLTAHVPAGTTLTVQTRSGNVQDPDNAAWSVWSGGDVLKPDPKAVPLAPRELNVGSPPARFLQYRLLMAGNGSDTPVADKVELTYVLPNIKPVISAVRATYAAGRGPGAGARAGVGVARPGAPGAGAAAVTEAPTSLTLEWDATDPNTDQLKFTLEYQAAGSEKWLPLAKDLEQPPFEWSVRRVPDGRYVVRVTASDAPDNTPSMAKTASRVSDPVLIDNTPPVLSELKTAAQPGGASFTARITDALSTVQTVHYAVDSTEDWQPVLPDDLIFDSTKESISVKISDLEPGPHVVTLRAVDAQGNATYQALQIDVKK